MHRAARQIHGQEPPGRPALRAALAGLAAFAVAVGGAVLLTTGSAAGADAANLLQNPGFESGTLAGWSCTAGSGTVVTSPVHSGVTPCGRPRPAATTRSAPSRSRCCPTRPTR